jgi:RHS repeat-associated protein
VQDGAVGRDTQGLGIIDEPLEVKIGSGSYYYSADGLGSVVALTKSNRSATNTYFGYNTFGWVNATDTVANPFRFTGREWDSETNLYYYRARYYDPLWGRFLSEDPATFNFGSNFYVYTRNSPPNLVDPTGFKPCCPGAEEQDIRREIEFQRSILTHLENGQSALSVGRGKVGGMTFCQSFRLPDGTPLPPQASTTLYIDPEKHPCLYKCADRHEAVHRRQCMNLGPHVFGKLTEAEGEIPAYTEGLGCLIHLLRSAGLSTTF